MGAQTVLAMAHHYCRSLAPVSQIKYFIILADACSEFAGPIFASLHPDNTAPFEEISQRCRAVSNTVSYLDLKAPATETNALLLDQLAGRPSRVIAPRQCSSFRRNVAAVASRWQHCVRFDRPEN